MKQQALTHLELIAGLSDADRRALTEKSDAAGLIRIFSHLLAITITGAWIVLALPLWQIAMVLHGILLCFLFTAEHEAIHGSAFKTYSLNVWVARLAGFLILLPPQWFRYFHFAHHRHTNDPAKDPELATPRPETVGIYLLHVSGLPYWTSQIRTLLINSSSETYADYVPERGRERVKTEARVMLGLYLVSIFGSLVIQTSVLLYVWVIPALLGQPFLRLALLSEHLFCPEKPDMLQNSRTTFTTSILRWFTWNMSFHAEHHAYPAVPFHRLPLFHKHTVLHLQVKQAGYARFHVVTFAKFFSRKN